ncbi:MAG: hypothetical protein AVDCRST_MAG67-4228 [uncultured Solirubrobacteraceae bacterium]|uniref:Peptidase S8/S53 domain-containing protein n=1 Tax=uncultured Solirubrobacteraceae bacterium TaxID=1162706 RepID=A0A6J4TNQ2_9ACTN|nr:MAG: hypothetical protein AVDCRST_MAG67-4228 [uncultured Solirubrobacteraceae bacterium]
MLCGRVSRVRSSALGRRAVLCVLVSSSLALAARPVAAAQAASTPRDGARAAAATVQPPNDPLFRHQWYLRAIQIPAAWAASRGEGATVAVLDTGVAYATRGPYRRAPDLAGTRFVAGWDFVDDDPHPHDVAPRDGRRSHGTQMAGIIAQTTNNAIGGAGVAPAAAIMPIRVLRPNLSGTATAIARGLRYAADHGADIVNLSVAGRSQTRLVRDAVAYATAKGVTVVAASGNDGRASVSWPAADPKVVAVGAVARDLVRAPYSNYGEALDLVAPAGAGALGDSGYGPPDGVVAQTLKGGPSEFCFCFTASTSAAAAQVSGVAALLVATDRARGPAAVRAALLRGTRDLGPDGRDREHGAGMVQAARALGVSAGEPQTGPSSRPRTPAPDEGADVRPALLVAAAFATGLALALASRRRRRRAG